MPLRVCVCVCVCVCTCIHMCVHAWRTRNRRGGQSGRAQKSSGLLVMGLWVILIAFLKLLHILKIFNNDYVLLSNWKKSINTTRKWKKKKESNALISTRFCQSRAVRTSPTHPSKIQLFNHSHMQRLQQPKWQQDGQGHSTTTTAIAAVTLHSMDKISHLHSMCLFFKVSLTSFDAPHNPLR